MNVDVISADVGVLPELIGAEYSAELDGADLYAFDALVQQLNAAITEISPPDTAVATDVVNDDVVATATVGVTQSDDAPVAETRDGDEPSSLTPYRGDFGPDVLLPPVPVALHLAPPDSNVLARELPVNPGPRTGPEVLPTPVPMPVMPDQAQPDSSSVFARQLPVPAAPDRAVVPTTVPVDTATSAEIMSVAGRSVALPTRQPELPILSSSTESGEPPTIPMLTASGSSSAEVRPGSVPSLADSTASLKTTPLPEMLIAGGQYHAKAVAHLPNLGTVQVEMTRASASEVAVHVQAAQALTVAALERSTATLQHLVASTIQPATEATVTEASYGSEPGIKIAMSLTSQDQSHANSRAFQPQGQSSRPEVVPVTLPERVASVTSLVDLLV